MWGRRAETTPFIILSCIVLLSFRAHGGLDTNEYPELGAEEERHFDNTVMSYMRERHIPGASIAISKDGAFLLRKGYGRATSHQLVSPWSLFRIGSVSKPLTAAGILNLYEKGRLCLDAPVFGPAGILHEYRPEAGGDPRLLGITVEHLLRHTGGWDQRLAGDPLARRDLNQRANRTGPIDKSTIIHFMMTQPLQFTPGTRFAYSNFGYVVLGRVIEAVTGNDYEVFIHSLLWRYGIYRMKLGSTRKEIADKFEVTYYTKYPGDTVVSMYPGDGLVTLPYGGFTLENMDASSGWVATPADLVRFFDLLNGTSNNRSRRSTILQHDTFNLMVAAPPVEEDQKVWYGMGLVVEDSGRTYWHSGHLEGSTGLLSHDESGYTWAVLLNYKIEDNDLSDLVRYAIRKFLPSDNHISSKWVSNKTPKGRSITGAVYLSSDSVSRDGWNIVKIMIPDYKFTETVSMLSSKNFRLKWIDAVDFYGVIYFNTIWTKDTNTKWRVYVDLSPSRYRRRFKSKLAQGYRVAHIETYVSRRRLRYAAIFVRDSWPPWVTYHGYSPHRHRDQFFKYLEQGYQLVVQSVTEYRGKVYVAAVYEKIYIGEIRVRMGLTLSDFGEELARQMKRGRILSYVQAYQHKGKVKFSAIWIPQTTSAWAVSHSMTKYTLLHKLQVYADVNVPLMSVTGYVEEEMVKFAAVWV